MLRALTFASFIALAAPVAAAPKPSDAVFQHSTAYSGLLPVHVDVDGGRILLTLPKPGEDGVSARYLYSTSLRTGLGSAPTFLDRGRVGQTQILAFRRLGKRVAAQFENPRFRATGAQRVRSARQRRLRHLDRVDGRYRRDASRR